MKNVTISLSDTDHQKARLAAARAGVSMSKYIAGLLERDMETSQGDADAETRRRLEALQRVFDLPKLEITENGRMPDADERNARR